MKKVVLSILMVIFVSFNLNANDEAFDEFENDFESPKVEVFDPLKSYNEFMTGVNDFVYTNLIFPVSKGYRFIVGENIRLGVSNFFDNLYFPINFANNVLQFKFNYAGEELAKFTINSIFGLGGFFDPASRNLNLQPHKEDFGQTLGYWGVGSGFHIVLPILGNSNLRDSLGFAVDSYANPMSYWSDRGYNVFDDIIPSASTKGFEILNKSSFEAENYEALKKDAVELYPFFRAIYEKNRQQRIAE